MRADTIIAYAYRADIYCEDCIGDVEEDGELDSDLRPQPIFCGEEVDSVQHCGDCGEVIDGFSVIGYRRFIVTRPIMCSTIVVATSPAEALEIAMKRSTDEFDQDEPQPSVDLSEWSVGALEE